MRTLVRLTALLALLVAGGIALIKIRYDVSWEEALEIADLFVEDLLP
jgi:hypothetical protein